eukprot:TRINITY_DN1365_c2_g1_i2.p1 TRINITY_DN1365_c2_g1~~TRINITY_DN1365_c2_g1_i2.p1  ORF type:complete len:163 (+),score=55.36 TRINITY_DN1365_c2_g1_i2:45-491(+)
MATTAVKQLNLNTKQIRVSSVLNKDIKQFGKQFLIDDSDQTCWNSDQGKSQFIIINFENLILLSSFSLLFQGGFTSKIIQLEIKVDEEQNWKLFQNEFYPEDSNLLQQFNVNMTESIVQLKINFIDSNDFFGRITIYKLILFGIEIEC